MSNNDLLDPRLGIGANQPPGLPALDAAMLQDMLATDAERAKAILATVETAVIVDGDTAGKVNTLAVQARDLADKIEGDRKERGRPYLEATRLVNDAHKALVDPLRLAFDSLRKMLDQYQKRQEREAAERRAAAEAEARKREQEAETARRRAEEAQAAGRAGTADRLAALKAQDEADAAARRAEAIRPEPIHSDAGSVSSRRERLFEITNYAEVMRWLWKSQREAMEEAARGLVDRYVRGIGIEVIERAQAAGTALVPGVRVYVGTKAAVRRR